MRCNGSNDSGSVCLCLCICRCLCLCLSLSGLRNLVLTHRLWPCANSAARMGSSAGGGGAAGGQQRAAGGVGGVFNQVNEAKDQLHDNIQKLGEMADKTEEMRVNAMVRSHKLSPIVHLPSVAFHAARLTRCYCRCCWVPAHGPWVYAYNRISATWRGKCEKRSRSATNVAGCFNAQQLAATVQLAPPATTAYYLQPNSRAQSSNAQRSVCLRAFHAHHRSAYFGRKSGCTKSAGTAASAAAFASAAAAAAVGDELGVPPKSGCTNSLGSDMGG